MLAEAKREAERVVKEARDQQARLISDEEVYKQAERAAEEIIEDARETERQIRLGAEDYADEILSTLEVNLEKFLAAVRRGRDRLAGRRGRAGRGRLAASPDRVSSARAEGCRGRSDAQGVADDAPRLADALARAFEDDPGLSHLLPDASDRTRRLRLFFETELRGDRAAARARLDHRGAWSGRAVWAPPDGWRVPITATACARCPRWSGCSGGGCRWRSARGCAWRRRHPRNATPLVPGGHGRRPGVAGQGPRDGAHAARRSRALDAAGAPAYLESSTPAQPRALRAQRVRGHGRVQPPSGGPPLWQMWREPAA